MTPKESAIALLSQDPTPTRADVARQLGIPTTTVQSWARAAGIPPGRRGRPFALPKHSYRLDGSIQTAALERLLESDVSDVAALLTGLVDGTLTITFG